MDVRIADVGISFVSGLKSATIAYTLHISAPEMLAEKVLLLFLFIYVAFRSQSRRLLIWNHDV